MALRRLGPFAPLSATYYDDDAIIEAGPEAETLFTRCLAFCSGSVSDGYITEAQLRHRVGRGLPRLAKRITALVDHGVLEQVEGGYTLRAWLKWNKSAAEREREKSRDRERKAERSPTGFQPELGTESDRNPGGNGEGIPSRARADGAHHSTSQHSSSHSTESDDDSHDDDRQADQLLDDTGPWTTELRTALRVHVLDAVPDFEPAGIKAALADYRTRLGDPRTRPGLLPFLIQQHAARLEPAKPTRPPWCGVCEESTRLLLNDDRDPIGPCPRCKP